MESTEVTGHKRRKQQRKKFMRPGKWNDINRDFGNGEYQGGCPTEGMENQISIAEQMSHGSFVGKNHTNKSVTPFGMEGKFDFCKRNLQAAHIFKKPEIATMSCRLGRNFSHKLKKKRRFKARDQPLMQTDGLDLPGKAGYSHRFLSRPVNTKADPVKSPLPLDEVSNPEADSRFTRHDFYSKQHINQPLSHSQDPETFGAEFMGKKWKRKKQSRKRKRNSRRVTKKVTRFADQDKDNKQSSNIMSHELSQVDSLRTFSRYKRHEGPHNIDWEQSKVSGNKAKHRFRKRGHLPERTNRSTSSQRLEEVSTQKRRASKVESQKTLVQQPPELESTSGFPYDSGKDLVRVSKKSQFDGKPLLAPKCVVIEDCCDNLNNVSANDALFTESRKHACTDKSSRTSVTSHHSIPAKHRDLCEGKTKTCKATQEKTSAAAADLCCPSATLKIARAQSIDENLKGAPDCVIIDDDSSDEMETEQAKCTTICNGLGKPEHCSDAGMAAAQSSDKCGFFQRVPEVVPRKRKGLKVEEGKTSKGKPRKTGRISPVEVSKVDKMDSGRISAQVSCEVQKPVNVKPSECVIIEDNSDVSDDEARQSRKASGIALGRVSNQDTINKAAAASVKDTKVTLKNYQKNVGIFPANVNAKSHPAESDEICGSRLVSGRQDSARTESSQSSECILLHDSSESSGDSATDMESSKVGETPFSQAKMVVRKPALRRLKYSDEVIHLKNTASKILPNERVWNLRRNLLPKKGEPVDRLSFLFDRPDDERHEVFLTGKIVKEVRDAGVECMTGDWREREVLQLHENVIWYCNFFGTSVDQMLDPFLEPTRRNVSAPLSYKIHRLRAMVWFKFKQLYGPKSNLFVEVFSKEEIDVLLKLYQKYGKRWTLIGDKMGRNAVIVQKKFSELEDCRFTRREPFDRRKYSAEEDEALVKAVRSMAMDEFGNIDESKIKWRRVAALIGSRTATSLRSHWYCIVGNRYETCKRILKKEKKCMMQKVGSVIIDEKVEDLADINWGRVAAAVGVPISPQILRHMFFKFLRHRLENLNSKSSSQVIQHIRDHWNTMF